MLLTTVPLWSLEDMQQIERQVNSMKDYGNRVYNRVIKEYMSGKFQAFDINTLAYRKNPNSEMVLAMCVLCVNPDDLFVALKENLTRVFGAEDIDDCQHIALVRFLQTQKRCVNCDRRLKGVHFTYCYHCCVCTCVDCQDNCCTCTIRNKVTCFPM